MRSGVLSALVALAAIVVAAWGPVLLPLMRAHTTAIASHRGLAVLRAAGLRRGVSRIAHSRPVSAVAPTMSPPATALTVRGLAI